MRPSAPRDAARLMVVGRTTGVTQVTRFSRLGTWLPAGAVVVLNDTRVDRVRLVAHKETGGKIELTIVGHRQKMAEALADRHIQIGSRLRIGEYQGAVLAKTGSLFRIALKAGSWRQVFQSRGLMPLPPYLRHSPLKESDRRRFYQSVFARSPGSAAAPTASLHFTGSLLQRLKANGFRIEFVTLHVGLGTFAPVTEKQLRRGVLHDEVFRVRKDVARRLTKWKADGRPIIAVGTTVARVLESAYRAGAIRPGSGRTNIFIRPGYRWRYVDGLVTNFHVPESSLMMLVASLVGRRRLLKLYAEAIRRRFKLFSLGDAMLVQPWSGSKVSARLKT